MTTARRCLVYARYSTDNQREASIEDQLRVCTARAEREGWVIAGTYSDAAISGATALRSGYQSLLEASHPGSNWSGTSWPCCRPSGRSRTERMRPVAVSSTPYPAVR